MNDHVPAPKSLAEFAKLLEDGKTVHLETGTDIHPKDFLEKLRDKLSENEGVFESSTSLVTQAVCEEPFPKWDSCFTDAPKRIGLLIYLQ